jgi:hypothetical protein
MRRPTVNVLFLKERQREESAVLTTGPNKLKRLLGVGPASDLMIVEKVIGEYSDVVSSINIGEVVVR